MRGSTINIDALRDRRVALWGWGREGRAAWRTLHDRGIAPLALFCNAAEAAEAQALDPVLLIEPVASAERLSAYEVVVKSPGISPYKPEAVAAAAGVSIRGGCFCNPGAAEAAFGFPHDETRRCLDRAAVGGFTVEGLSTCLGPKVPVGAVRASFGIPTTLQDIDRAVEVIESFA